jgi:hypothetical protein
MSRELAGELWVTACLILGTLAIALAVGWVLKLLGPPK